MTKPEFRRYVRGQCAAFGVRFYQSRHGCVNTSNGRASGVFRAEGRKAVLAVPRDCHIGVLAHEYCHLLQWLGNPDWFFETPTQALEWDCEKRTCRLLRTFKLPVDLARYRQVANAYLYSYAVWPAGDFTRNPAEVPEIVGRMPGDRIAKLSVYANPPAWYLAACDKLKDKQCA